MKRLGERAWDALSFAGGILIATGILFLTFSTWQYMPCLDGWLVPIVRFSAVTEIHRDPQSPSMPTGRACFTLHTTKLGAGIPVTYHFRLRTWLSPEIGVAAYIVKPDDTRDIQRYDTHPPGQTWDRRYCFELPGTIADADDLTVTGSAIHRRHPFWNTETPVPSFVVPALKGSPTG